ncbi:MAG: ABC transporter substrate-binding protein [Pseudomonas sp.]|uniref:substrate-binding periplasmic protein n=1 Tax=Pseudomonas sp. TaxID=306 RepID=UPI003BB4FB6D
MNLKLLWQGLLFGGALTSVSAHSAPLEVLTEDYPPFNMMAADTKISGLSTEIVEELFKRAGVEYKIKLLPWKRAYEQTLNTPNTVLYSTTRTPEREELFKWVGPLVSNNWVFFAKSDSPLKVTSLDDAKQYSVGGYYGDAVAEYLAAQGFSKLQLAPNDRSNAKKLDAGRIQLWATGEYLGPYLAALEKATPPKVIFTFRETQMSLAFNKSAPDDLILKLNETLEVMRKEGVIDRLNAKYH